MLAAIWAIWASECVRAFLVNGVSCSLFQISIRFAMDVEDISSSLGGSLPS
jgi:hypothetical protein